MSAGFASLLVLGGARSGKSRHAQAAIEACGGKLAYVATGQAFDAEMTERIARHRDERDHRWHTIEAPLDLAAAIRAAGASAQGVLVDCLTLWLTNLILADRDPAHFHAELLDAIAGCPVPIALVSNEVGMGIVPENALSRRFRDEAGRLNQIVAASAERVVFLAAGLPLVMKG